MRLSHLLEKVCSDGFFRLTYYLFCAQQGMLPCVSDHLFRLPGLASALPSIPG
jgi:hypothetical protein